MERDASPAMNAFGVPKPARERGKKQNLRKKKP
jgi:hypothetical protein